MKSETTKAFALRVALLSAGVAVAWHLVVGSQVAAVQELKVSLETQATEIQIGEEAISSHAESVASSVHDMSEIRQVVTDQFDMNHRVNSHKFLQAAAEDAGLTVLRVEPLGVRKHSKVNVLTMEELVLETEEYRLECIGAYEGLIQFFEAIDASDNIAKVNTFRIVPLSKDSTRALMQVSMYQMTEAPKAFTQAMASATSSSDTGANNGNE